MTPIKDSLIRAALAQQIEARMAGHPPNAAPHAIARDLADFALERLEAMVSALEWYRDASPAERSQDSGVRARIGLGMTPR